MVRRVSLSIGLATLLVVGGAAAQTKPKPAKPTPAKPEPPPPPPPADPPPPVVEKTPVQKEAEEHFVRARQLYEEGDFQLALVEFTRAYDLSPNFRVLYNIGQVNIQLVNYAAARVALERYLKDGGKDIPAARKTQTENDLKMLEGRTAYIQVTTTPAGASVSFDEQPLGTAPFDEAKLVNGGTHKVSVSKEGYVAQTKSLTLAGGDKTDIKFDLVEAPKDKPVVFVPQSQTHKNYTPAVIGWIATGAIAIGAGIVGGLYLSQESEIDRLSNPREPLDRQEKNNAESSATRLAVTADVLGLVAVAAGLVSVYFTLRPPQTVSSITTGMRPGPNGFKLSF